MISTMQDSSVLQGTKFHLAHTLDQQCQKDLLTPNPMLDAAASNSKAQGLPDIAISPLQGQYLALQCRLIKAKTVLELGTLGGYSTIWFASSGAHVTSIEINPKRHAIAKENTQSLDNVDLVLGSALDVMPQFVKEGRKFDFVFVDADWDEQWKFFDLAIQLTNLGGCIYVDNVVREMVESDLVGEGKESLVSKVGADSRVEATLIPTVGSHKSPGDMMDGFLLAIVKQ